MLLPSSPLPWSMSLSKWKRKANSSTSSGPSRTSHTPVQLLPDHILTAPPRPTATSIVTTVSKDGKRTQITRTPCEVASPIKRRYAASKLQHDAASLAAFDMGRMVAALQEKEDGRDQVDSEFAYLADSLEGDFAHGDLDGRGDDGPEKPKPKQSKPKSVSTICFRNRFQDLNCPLRSRTSGNGC